MKKYILTPERLRRAITGIPQEKVIMKELAQVANVQVVLQVVHREAHHEVHINQVQHQVRAQVQAQVREQAQVQAQNQVQVLVLNQAQILVQHQKVQGHHHVRGNYERFENFSFVDDSSIG